MGNTEGFDDNVRDIHELVGDSEGMPCLALVEGVDDLVGLLGVLGHNDEATVVSDFVDMGALAHLEPCQTAVPREISVHSVYLESL